MTRWVVMLLFLAAAVAVAQEWELGVSGGLGFSRNATVTNASGERQGRL